MKRTAVNHNKTNYLRTLLKRPRFHILGILESMWQLASRDFRRGNIGKISNERIASELEWDGDPDELVKALESAGFLDSHPEHRLIIHDWSHHCEDSVHMDLARKGEYFADGTKPKLSRLSEKERRAAEIRYESGHVVPEQPDLFKSVRTNAHGERPASAVAPPMPLPTDTPLPPTPEPPVSDGGGFSIPEKLQTETFQEAWKLFLEHNAGLKFPYPRTSLQLILTEKLLPWGPDIAATALHVTMLGGGKEIKKPTGMIDFKKHIKPRESSPQKLADLERERENAAERAKKSGRPPI